MKNKTYDTLRFISLIIAPICAFFSVLANAWGIPYGDAIAATLTGLDVLFGTIVEIARNIYYRRQENETDS